MEPTTPSEMARVPWRRLRAWIDRQEDYEKEHNRAAPLSRGELAAISLLVSFGDEPEMVERDYVSLLLHETQSRHHQPPAFMYREPALVPVDGHFQPKWSCVCFIAECGSFPRERHGVEAGQRPPVFQAKKNAKRYAAMCALQYLQQTVVGGAGAAVSTAREPTVAATPPLAPYPGPTRGDPTRTSPRTQPQPKVPSRPKSGASNPEGDEGSVFRHVSDLATSLGLCSPRYEIVADGDMPGFFRGRPVFAHVDMVPSGLGEVSDVLGKRQAKLQVAEKVLQWLEAERRKRRDVFDSLYRKKS